MNKIILSFFILLTINAFAGNYLDDNLRKFNWNGIDVIWLEDNQYPTYTFNVYFDAGASLDDPRKLGETELAFNQLIAGTTRYKQKEILDALEFYGAGFGASVTHEYSTYSVGGLVKDMVPTMKMICHMFSEATYPKSEIDKTKKRILTGLKNLVTNHGSLANRVFREVSLEGTPFEKPVSGTMSTINRISGKDLANKLKFFNEKVKKRIYISGPSSVKAIKDVVINDCKWSSGEFSQKSFEVAESKNNNKHIFLVPVPDANQAQIRIGRALTTKEASENQELNGFAAKFIGGGFTSQLMRELRVKRGLTYSAGAYSSSQKNYGRSGINTFTKNKTIVETLKVIEETIEKNSKNIETPLFEHSKRFVKGSYLFGLESTHEFLNNLIFFDHIGRDYSEIYKYQERINSITSDKLAEYVDKLFNTNKQTILILGDKGLLTPLKKAGYKVKILNYKKYL